MGHFFSSSHLSTLVALFLLYHQKIFAHILFWSQLVSVCFTMKFFFSFKIHSLQMFQLFQTRDGPIFFIFHRHTCLHVSRFFCCIIKKYLSHILFWSQLVSVCFAMEFFFSFKIHCLQMLLLFQSKNGSFFQTFAEMNIKLSYIKGYAQNGKAEEGTCYSCHVVTA